eukprot:1270022-Amphidinium_carterae.2
MIAEASRSEVHAVALRFLVGIRVPEEFHEVSLLIPLPSLSSWTPTQHGLNPKTAQMQWLRCRHCQVRSSKACLGNWRPYSCCASTVIPFQAVQNMRDTVLL